MRVSKLEPHVLQLAADDHNDVDTFLAEVQEESLHVPFIKTDSGLTEESLHQSFTRLADFIKKEEKKKTSNKSRKAMGLACYQEQLRYSGEVSQEEMENLRILNRYR